MKFDKDTLIKQRFWVLGAVALPLILVCFIFAGPIAGRAIFNQEKVIKTELDALTSASRSVKGPESVKNKQEEAKLHDALKTVVWAKAWKSQAEVPTWPEAMEKKYNFKAGLFAIDIKAERRKIQPYDGTASEPPAKVERQGQFQGVIKKTDADKILVEGFIKLGDKAPEGAKDAAEGAKSSEGAKDEPKRLVRLPFYNTTEIKVQISGELKDKKEKFVFSDLHEPDEKDKTEDVVTITYQVGKYFGDPLTEREAQSFVANYASQLHDVLKVLDPASPTGGVVQLRESAPSGSPKDARPWKYSETKLPPVGAPFFSFVRKWELTSKDISKEAWTAQEDLWIQRELFRLIRKANDAVATFRGEGGDGIGKEFTFTNPYWELKLTLTPQNTLTGKIRNRLKRRQHADIGLVVRVRKGGEFPTQKVFVGNLLPLKPDEEKEIPDPLPVGDGATGIYGVEQILTTDTAAVKRLDLVMLGPGVGGSQGAVKSPVGTGLDAKSGPGMMGGGAGGGSIANSHRTFTKPLLAYPFPGEIKAPVVAKEAPDSSDPSKGSMPKFGTGGFGKKDEQVSTNGIRFERYIALEKEVRRVPVCLVLIVDQQHTGVVQTAFADSQLRFLTTQVLLSHYPHSVHSAEVGRQIMAGAPSKASMPSGPLGPFGGPMSFPGGGGMPMPPAAAMAPPPSAMAPVGGIGMMPGGIATANAALASISSDQEANMELVLYGVVSLYERFPPKTGDATPGS
jgi:hypothetical protein